MFLEPFIAYYLLDPYRVQGQSMWILRLKYIDPYPEKTREVPHLQSRLSTCNCLYRCNDNLPINPGLLKGGAKSWLLKSTSATAFTMWNDRERSPGDAPLPPDLMNVYLEKMAGKKSGENCLEYSCPGLILPTQPNVHTLVIKSTHEYKYTLAQLSMYHEYFWKPEYE